MNMTIDAMETDLKKYRQYYNADRKAYDPLKNKNTAFAADIAALIEYHNTMVMTISEMLERVKAER